MSTEPRRRDGLLRVLDTGNGEPAWNMALDDALLQCGGPPTLRLYGWAPAGLSLGWFQPLEPFLDVQGPHRIVRRRTGGGAIYHAEEITFSLTLDADALPHDVAASYVLLHGAVQRALAGAGVEVRLVPGNGGCGTHARPRDPWCFATPGPHDLVLAGNGRKIVGSAQRRLRAPRARVLHHGSIVLRASAATPFCGAVADVVEPEHAAATLRAALVVELARVLGLEPVPADGANDDERQHAARALPLFSDPRPHARVP